MRNLTISVKILLLIFLLQPEGKATPRLTVILVIDQFAYNYIPKLKSNFTCGFKKLLDNGIVFTNAHHPHGATTTATGHTAIGTGCYAKDHGITLNGWYDQEGQMVRCFDDTSDTAKVFTLDGMQDYGKSAKNLMCDGLSDQFILASKPNKKHISFSISNKPRAAIGMSGKLGKAIWFDDETGLFTSSKTFFAKMPEWLIDFNKQIDLQNLGTIEWKLFYKETGKEYDFRNINLNEENEYKFSAYKSGLIKKKGINIGDIKKINKKGKYNPKEDKFALYLRTPLANKHLLDLAQNCIEEKLNDENEMLLWISLSPLDKLGHIYGPNSIEITDMIYHLDKQIENFMKFAEKKVGNKNLLFVLTADHGVEPITEVMKKDNFSESIRIQYKPLIKKMNEIVEEKFGISKIIQGFKTSSFFMDRHEFDKLNPIKQKEITKELKIFLKKQPGVKNIWTFDELKNLNFQEFELEDFYKQQLYPKRSGDLICQPEVYCTFTKYPTGTSHRSAYEYNTHVPLFLYQKGKLEKKVINEKVWIPQLTVTLAKILNVQKPSASTFEMLPIF